MLAARERTALRELVDERRREAVRADEMRAHDGNPFGAVELRPQRSQRCAGLRYGYEPCGDPVPPGERLCGRCRRDDVSALSRYTCIAPGCEEPVASNRGLYCRCEKHRKQRAPQRPTDDRIPALEKHRVPMPATKENGSGPSDGLTGSLADLDFPLEVDAIRAEADLRERQAEALRRVADALAELRELQAA